jgi:hypothetical protein
MEAAKESGDYHDPDAGKVLLGDFVRKWLDSRGILDLALADDAIRKNPAKSPVVHVPGHQAADIEVLG